MKRTAKSLKMKQIQLAGVYSGVEFICLDKQKFSA